MRVRLNERFRMSAQILLQGRLRGTEDFLLAAPADRDNRAFEARSMWLVLIGEAVPRALLAELQLPPLMLGSSGGDRFVVILPDQARAEAAGQFLDRVSQNTERNQRRQSEYRLERDGESGRLDDRPQAPAGRHAGGQPSARSGAWVFRCLSRRRAPAQDRIPRDLRDVAAIGWSFDFPALIAAEGGEYRWDVGSDAAIPVTRHGARNGEAFATTKELARRATGRDSGACCAARSTTTKRACAACRAWKSTCISRCSTSSSSRARSSCCARRANISSASPCFIRGGVGLRGLRAWDALAGFARELERVFSRFAARESEGLAGRRSQDDHHGADDRGSRRARWRARMRIAGGISKLRAPPIRIVSTFSAACSNGSS